MFASVYNRLAFFVWLITCGFVHQTPAQPRSFTTNGNNIELANCSEVIFSGKPEPNHFVRGNGSAWYQNKLDLAKPFDLGFFVYYRDKIGTTEMLANDGFAFVLQTAGLTSLGAADEGLGFKNITPSVAITLDRVRHQQDDDPPFDHLAIQVNGDTRHQSPNNVAGPVNIEPYYQNIPGLPAVTILYAYLNITWNPLTQQLQVYVDKTLVLSATYDLVNTIFKGTTMVNWGFTASNTYTSPLAAAGMTLGYTRLYFGYIFPGFVTEPGLDTCYSKEIGFFDDSHYDRNDVTNSIGLARWYWDFGNGITSSARNPPPQIYPGPGEYTVKFAVGNQIGCTVDTLVKTIKLGSKPAIAFGWLNPCTDNPTLFSDSTVVRVGNANEWHWTFNDTDIRKERNPSYTFARAGPQSVSLVVRTNLYCSDTLTKTIVIKDKPDVDFTYVKDCAGSVYYTGRLLNNEQVSAWLWSFGDRQVAEGANPVHHYNTNGIYMARLVARSQEGCVSDTVQQPVSINAIYAFAGNDTVVAKGQPLQLLATGGRHYQWAPAALLNDPLVPDPVARPQNDQTYIVSVKNDDGCEARDSIKVTVYAGPAVYVPNAFTPNNDARNDLLKAFIPGLKTLHYFKIYNRWGQPVFETKNIRQGWNGETNGRLQPGGTYVWMIAFTDYLGKRWNSKGTATIIR